VILAGGRGERMAAGRNKALLDLAGRPLLLHSLTTFAACCDRLVVVGAVGDLPAIRGLVPTGTLVVEGGASRHGSEWRALQSLRAVVGEDDLVAIHDAARPLVLEADVRAVLREAERHGAAMLGAPSDSPALTLADGRVAMAYPREDLWRAQTPQAGRGSWLFQAYEMAAASDFDGTDTAAVLQRAGYPVRVVAASGENPKVTVAADLADAENLLASRLEGVGGRG
jgi:2-C-methyl-D-erythritol 4-phosphate cytidylyltransferase